MEYLEKLINSIVEIDYCEEKKFNQFLLKLQYPLAFFDILLVILLNENNEKKTNILA